jgi:endonuclease I
MRHNVGLFSMIIFFSNCFGQVPINQVSNVVLSEKRAWRLAFTLDVPMTADSAIALVSLSPNQPLTLANKIYKTGEYPSLGWKVVTKVSKGTKTITVKGLTANTTYYFALLTFNNNMNGVYYKKDVPFLISTKTSGREIGTYYKSLDTNKTIFLSQLASLLKAHPMQPYVDFRNIVTEIYERDTFLRDSSLKYVVCDYSDIIAVYNAPFSFFKTNTNREHTLPKNWMNFRFVTNDSLENVPEGADYHNLSMTDAVVNSARSDYAMDVVSANIVNYGKAKLNNNSNFSMRRFEPQDRYKGNAARCMFYNMICYNGTMNKTWGFRKDLKSDAQYQSQALLKTWSKADTVDNFEIARNECIYAIQGSRNPFIDFPDWADCLNFDDIIQLKTCSGLYISDTTTGGGGGGSSITQQNSNWDVWYYPYSPENYILKFYLDEINLVRAELFDIGGKIVLSENIPANIGENSSWLHTSSIAKGHYFLRVSSSKLQKTLRFVIE